MGMPITMGRGTRVSTGVGAGRGLGAPGLLSGTSASRLASTPAGRSNRRSAPPWRERLPPVREVAQGVGRLARRALPGVLALAAVAAVLGLLVLGHRFVTRSPRFAITTIRFEGNVARSDAQLRAELPVADGANIFSTHLGSLERALAADPWLAQVHVTRELPHTLVVRVVERVPVAIVELSGLYLVDASGTPFKRLRGGEGAGLPVITGIGRAEYTTAPDEAAATVRRALAALATWSSPGAGGAARPSIGEIHVGSRRELVLYRDDANLEIRLGAGALADPAELTARLTQFDRAWAALTPRERAVARVLHLDNAARPDRVTVALATPAPTSPAPRPATP